MKGFTMQTLTNDPKLNPNSFGDAVVYRCLEDYCPFGFFAKWEISQGREIMDVIKEHYREFHQKVISKHDGEKWD